MAHVCHWLLHSDRWETLEVPPLQWPGCSKAAVPQTAHLRRHLLTPQQHSSSEPATGQRTTWRSCFSPSIMWGPGIKCRLLGLVENTFPSEPSYWLERVWTSLYITGFGFLGCLLIAHSKGWAFLNIFVVAISKLTRRHRESSVVAGIIFYHAWLTGHLLVMFF